MMEIQRLVEMFDETFVDPNRLIKFSVAPCWAANTKKLLGYQAVMFPLFSKAASVPIGPRRVLNADFEETAGEDIGETLRSLAQKDIEIFAYSAGYKIFQRQAAVLELDQFCKAQDALRKGLRKE